jgi:murein DD-endopeptidase MepM/ murein hydrolase activator NlpD
MEINYRGILVIAATTLLTCFSPELRQPVAHLGNSAFAANPRIADEFRHPLATGDVSENYGDPEEQWYVSKDFGDPLGKACSSLATRICYNLGEDWTHERNAFGKPVFAVANGEILDFGFASTAGGKLPESLGNYILIKHTLPAPGRRIPGQGLVTTVVSLYAHLRDLRGICGNRSTDCRPGQRVRIGALIGHIGQTGNVADPQLHFEMRLTEEKCFDNPKQTVPNASCLKYSAARYPARYARGGGWVDPTCFINDRRAPRNDDVARAVAIGVKGVRTGSNTCATKEDDELNHAGKRIRKNGQYADGKSVWWKFTAPDSIQYTITTLGSEFDTTLGVYVAKGEGKVTAADLAAVARNDLEQRALCDATGYCTSKVTFDATAGTTYYIAVDGASHDGIASANGDVKLTVAEADQSLYVTPSASSFQPALEGGPFSPSSINFQVSASADNLPYSVSNVPAWLTPPKTFGKAGRSPRFLAFAINDEASQLKAGVHTATLVFGTPGSQLPQTRKVTLRVRESSTLQVSPTSGLNVSGDAGGPFDPSSASYQLSSSSGGKLRFRISGAPNWLTVSAPSGIVAKSPQSVTLSVNSNANSLAAGTYNATITVANTTNGKGTTAIPVSITVKGVPKLQVSPVTAMMASGPTGGPFNPVSFPYALTASTGQVNYTISGLPNWLSVSPSSGTATTSPTMVTFALNANANSLPAGNYGATIQISNTTNGQGTTAISAGITVTAPVPVGYLMDGVGGYILADVSNDRITAQ